MTTRPREPRDRFARLAASLREEMEQPARIVSESGSARSQFAAKEPTSLELRGIGDLVHDFYTGAERIFEKIAPELNGGIPAGAAWHRELLDNMTLDLPGIRPPVLRKKTARALAEFLRFRHLFRNLYGFELEWPRLRPLLDRMPAAWDLFREDLERFLAFLDATATS